MLQVFLHTTLLAVSVIVLRYSGYGYLLSSAVALLLVASIVGLYLMHD